MSRIFRRISFAGEYVAEMRLAGVADNFRSRSVGIGNFFHRIRNFLIKARPTAAGMKFGIRGIERGVASPADIGAVAKIIRVLAGKRHFRTFVNDDAFFIGGEGVEVRRHIVGRPGIEPGTISLKGCCSTN